MWNNRKKELQDKVASGFLGFWIKNFRISYLATAVVILLGALAIIQIPKESMPEVDLWMVTVTTVYPGANPEDIDSQITEKIYNAIKDIDGIDSISSTSSLGVSSVQISGKTGFDIKDIRADVQSKIDSLNFPSDARDPSVGTVETNTNLAFSMYIFEKNNTATTEELMAKAISLKNHLKSLSQIDVVSVAYNPVSSGLGSSSADDSEHDIEILIDHKALESHGLTLSQISQAISGFNTDMPIGNFDMDDKSYDYRISGKNIYATDFLKTPISLPNGGNITLGDISKIQRKYNSKKTATVAINENNEIKSYKAIGLVISKTNSASIFGAAAEAKTEIEKIFQQQEYKNFWYFYTSDTAEIITTDYIDLLKNFLSTLALVFAVMLFFVGFVDSLFATLMLPLAFLGTFIMLNSIGFTMNMLTNFSLIIALGIAIDTIIVFVQAASAKIKIGYDPQTAIILAFKEYAMSIIVGTTTTIMVFIPIMSLPGVMGRFLAFIPVTIFGVLFFGLVFALTINGALYKAFIRPKKHYSEDATTLEYATPEQKELLLLEREGKILKNSTDLSLRARLISGMTEKYKNFMDTNLRKKSFRIFAIIFPIIFFFLGFKIFAPHINFELMPADDNNKLAYTVESSIGTNTDAMNALIGDISSFFEWYPEIQNVAMVTNNNTLTVDINLTNKDERTAKNQKTAFDLEKEISQKLSSLEARWLKFSGGLPATGPGGSSAIGINLQAKNNSDLQTLITTARDFENFIASLPEAKNITNSSKDTPWQFVFMLKKDLLSQQGIAPGMIYQTISHYTNGLKVGEIKDGENDIDIIIKDDSFTNDITPDKILSIPLKNGTQTFQLKNFVEIKPQNAIASISREDGKIEISIGADLVDGANSIAMNQKILDFAKNYDFPDNISYSSGGAQSDNSDLIVSMVTSLVLALLGIFAVLTWQFNSYSKPALVFYSVFMALPFVLFGLLITGNPFSLMFGIGFIALMGISVNHGIILLEGVDQNLDKWMDGFMALIESSVSRLEPMLLTTLTTVLGMIPLTMAGTMWAGLAWTIIFGLMATTFVALFSLGPLYYELFVKEKTPWKWKTRFQNIFRKIFYKKQKITRRVEESEK